MTTTKNKNHHHLIFEGAELVGKSFLIAQIYDFLEKKYNTSSKVLNGCHWFNSDVGIFGTANGRPIINAYIEMLKILKNKNVLFEKFYLTDKVYNKLYGGVQIDYAKEEAELKNLGAKIILITVKDKKIFQDRIPDRLNNVPHFKRAVQTPADYWQQQELFLELIRKTKLDYIIIDFSYPLNKNFVKKQVNKILKWIGEI